MKRILVSTLAAVTIIACKTDPQSSNVKDVQVSDPCHERAINALITSIPAIKDRISDVTFQVEFDCRESNLIRDFNAPVTSAKLVEEVFLGYVASSLQPGFVKRSLQILQPYCRSDNEAYGEFCMAADVDSAFMVFNNPQMLRKLPDLVLAIADLIESRQVVNFFDAALAVYGGPRTEAALLTGFVGLDDNGVQFDRLRANLLHAERYDDYAAVFKVSAQYATLGHLTQTDLLLKVLYATRVGKATLPGVATDSDKTYKAYAGFYFGCRLAQEGEYGFIATTQAYLMGASYELIKTRELFGKSWSEIRSQLSRYANSADKTGKKMAAGAAYGYELCSPTR